jgi:hypothetical protein
VANWAEGSKGWQNGYFKLKKGGFSALKNFRITEPKKKEIQ